MKLIFEDLKSRKVTRKEEVNFSALTVGLYLVEISARARSGKQIGQTDDEDLRVEIDGRKFSKLDNPQRYLDSPAAFSGADLKRLKQTVFFIIPLANGPHVVSLVADEAATLEGAKVWQVEPDELSELRIPLNLQAEDGDRRPWLTFILVDLSLESFYLAADLRRRFIDSDDLKVIIDGRTWRNHRSLLHKFWYFVASLRGGERQAETFTVGLPLGPHYLELHADRRPLLHEISFREIKFTPPAERSQTEIIKDKIRQKAREFGFDPEMIVRLVQRESQFSPEAVSSQDAKGLFQLVSLAVEQVRREGYVVNDIFDIDQNITAGLVYFRWLYRFYKGEKDQLIKTLAAWNWGLSNVPRGQPLDFGELPGQTKGLINFVLGR